MRWRNRNPQQPVAPWSRERLLATLLIGILTILVLMSGLAVAIWQAATGAGPQAGTNLVEAGPGSSDTVRDRIAAEPMLAVSRDDATRGAPAVVQPEGIVIPEPARLDGPAGVPTGFPHTPEGAVGQLAQIEATVLDSMSIDTARAVHGAWVREGGPSLEEWVMTRSVQSFVRASGATERTAVVKATPVAAQVKGTNGPDWVVACVLLDVHASLQAEARVGFGHCERMAWVEGRWVIDAGIVPAEGRGGGLAAVGDRGGAAMIPIMPWDILGLLGSAVGNVITDGWIALMMGLWSASLWLLAVVLGFMDALLVPDLRLEGPGRDIYMITIALAIALAGVLTILQVGVALVRRDGRSVGRLLVGVASFWFFLTVGIAYMVAVLAAASAIPRSLMHPEVPPDPWRHQL